MQTKGVQVQQVENFTKVISFEDHLMDGGFGSWLMEATSIRADLLDRIKIKSLDSRVCGMVAKQSTLNTLGGLTDQD
jgi:transketolase